MITHQKISSLELKVKKPSGFDLPNIKFYDIRLPPRTTLAVNGLSRIIKTNARLGFIPIYNGTNHESVRDLTRPALALIGANLGAVPTACGTSRARETPAR